MGREGGGVEREKGEDYVLLAPKFSKDINPRCLNNCRRSKMVEIKVELTV